MKDFTPIASTSSTLLTRAEVVRELLELITALDRRVPQMLRAGEAAIASDAALLKARALKRLEELEHNPTAVESL
jgi:hypothetical protein